MNGYILTLYNDNLTKIGFEFRILRLALLD